MSYTQAAALAVVLTLVLDLLVLRTRMLARKAYWTSYAIVAFFQLLTNEWLTGRHVVVYDEHAIIGWHLGHAPVEDLAFGFALVTQSMAWWVWWGRRGVQPEVGPGPRSLRPVLTRSARRTRR